MIFDNPRASFSFLSAIRYSDNGGKFYNNSRPFCFLSYRINSDAEIVSGKQKIPVTSGDITFFPASASYCRRSVTDDLISVSLDVYNDDTPDICVYKPKDRAKFRAMFDSLTDICKKNNPGCFYEANAVINNIFAQIFIEKQSECRHSEKFLTAKKFIDKNFSDPELTVETVAAFCGLSPGYMRRLFQKEIHLSPKQYLTSARIQYASSLMNSGYYKISEVAEMSGFYDPKYFSQVYKKQTQRI